MIGLGHYLTLSAILFVLSVGVSWLFARRAPREQLPQA